MKERQNRGLKSACAAAALVSCWSGAAVSHAEAGSSSIVRFETNLASGLENAYLVYGNNFSILFNEQVLHLGSIASGEQSMNVQLEGFGENDLNGVFWVLIGTSGDDGVSLNFNEWYANTQINPGVTTWSDLYNQDKGDIFNAMTMNDTGTLIQFIDLNIFSLGDWFGETSQQFDFSTATLNGTARLTHLPAPGAIALLGCAAFVGRRRRH